MRTLRDPQQTRLFDPFDPVLTERTRRALLEDWQGVFRHVLLELMPMEALGGSFDPSIGRLRLPVSVSIATRLYRCKCAP